MENKFSILRDSVTVGNEPAMNYCLIEASTPVISGQIRTNVDLVLVIDKSGSMSFENKLNHVQKAAEEIVKLLDPNDRIGIVAFADSATEIVPLSYANNKSYFIDSIRNIHKANVGGSTVMSSGINIAYNSLRSSGGENIKRVILLTDGEVTEEQTETIKAANLCREYSIEIKCVGIGSAWNKDLLNIIDHKHDAKYIESGKYDKVIDSFTSEFNSMSNTYALDVIFKFNLVKGVVIQKFNRFHPRIAPVDSIPDGISFNVGSLQSNSIEYFLIQMIVPPRNADGNYILGNVEVSFTDMSSKQQKTKKICDIRLSYTRDPIAASMVNQEVQNYVKQLTAHAMVERATAELGKGNVAMGTSILGKAARLTGELGNTDLQRMLTSTLDKVQKTGLLSADDEKEIFYGSRKTSLIEKE